MFMIIVIWPSCAILKAERRQTNFNYVKLYHYDSDFYLFFIAKGKHVNYNISIMVSLLMLRSVDAAVIRVVA